LDTPDFGAGTGISVSTDYYHGLLDEPSEPSHEFQVHFLLRFQRLLKESRVTATYKYALLAALADIAVENRVDTDAILKVRVLQIVEKYITYYWRHAAPYLSQPDQSPRILQQNTGKQATIVTEIAKARCSHHGTLSELKRDFRAWHDLLRVNPDFWDQALWRIQRVGNEVHDFLYENRAIGTCVEEIELRPGIAFCLRRFHVMLTQMVRSAWLAHVRRVNGAALGATADLEEFLFGSDRADLSGIRLALIEIQNGVCFYCRSNLPSGAGDVDHFIPWSRYPVDLGHNFVIAHAACNGAKGSMLAAVEHLGRWAERNRISGPVIEAACDCAGMMHNRQASAQIAAWAYEQEAAAGGALWRAGKTLTPITDLWRQALE
jgi:hypothetical protein